MARTKGSLSRKTLAKQLGISLEEYLELEKNGKLEEYRAEHGIVDTVSSSISNEAEKERKEEVKTEFQAKKISKPGKTPSVSQDYKPSEKLTTSTKPNITKDTIIILPKNKAEILPKTEVNTPKAKPNEEKRSPKSNETFCSRCHKLILKDSSFRLILSNMIPGIASYHYNVNDKQILCYDCAHGLARVIEEYFESESDLASKEDSSSEIEDKEINDTASIEPDDINIKEMVKPSDSSGNEEEDLIF